MAIGGICIGGTGDAAGAAAAFFPFGFTPVVVAALRLACLVLKRDLHDCPLGEKPRVGLANASASIARRRSVPAVIHSPSLDNAVTMSDNE